MHAVTRNQRNLWLGRCHSPSPIGMYGTCAKGSTSSSSLLSSSLLLSASRPSALPQPSSAASASNLQISEVCGRDGAAARAAARQATALSERRKSQRRCEQRCAPVSPLLPSTSASVRQVLARDCQKGFSGDSWPSSCHDRGADLGLQDSAKDQAAVRQSQDVPTACGESELSVGARSPIQGRPLLLRARGARRHGEGRRLGRRRRRPALIIGNAQLRLELSDLLRTPH